MIDFGMVGTVDARTQEHLTRVILAVMRADTDQLVDVMLDLGVAHGRADRAALRHDLEQLLAHYAGQALGEIAIEPLLERTLAVVRRHRLQLPPNLALLLKTMIMNEGMGARLDPDFRLVTVLAPYAERLVLRQISPTRLVRRLSQASMDMARLGVDLPQQLRRILSDLQRGDLAISVRPEDFEPLMRRFEQLANRIVLGILAAAFIGGLAVLLAVYHPPGWEQWAGVFFAVGFVVAAALGAYLAWTMLHSGRGS